MSEENHKSDMGELPFSIKTSDLELTKADMLLLAHMRLSDLIEFYYSNLEIKFELTQVTTWQTKYNIHL